MFISDFCYYFFKTYYIARIDFYDALNTSDD